jgi:predicted glycosyltransferase
MAESIVTPRVFFYVQHLLGIGHLVRANRIAQALLEDGFDVTVAMGGVPVAGFPGPGIRLAALPPVRASSAGFTALEDASGNPVDDAFMAARRARLLAALEECQPNVVVVETFPFGRRVMRFELLPLLEATYAMAQRPLIACSLRDILQERSKPGRAEETVRLVEKYFDLVLVHGDPRFALLDETFPLAGAIADKILYTGLVAGPPPPPPSDKFDIVISAGGGAAGARLINAATQMAESFARNRRCCLLTGPNLPASEFEALKALSPPGLDIFNFRSDLPSLLCGTQLSVSQAGYNTVCDILRAGCRSLLVPFAKGGETEQTARAQRLKRLSIAEMLPEDGLDAVTLSGLVETILAGPPPPRHNLDLGGARQTAALLRKRLSV